MHEVTVITVLENVDRAGGTLQHECTFEDHPSSANVPAITMADWDHEKGRLMVTSEYEFEHELQAFSQSGLCFRDQDFFTVFTQEC
jgi:hypothetical protein